MKLRINLELVRSKRLFPETTAEKIFEKNSNFIANSALRKKIN